MLPTDITQFHRTGISSPQPILSATQYNALVDEYKKSLMEKSTTYYNQLAGLHNPWGKSAHIFDSWAMLDICQSSNILEMIVPLIGPDIILWESAFYGYNALQSDRTWTRHCDFSPIDPMNGIVVRIALGEQGVGLDYLSGSHTIGNLHPDELAVATSLQLNPESAICHDVRLAYRYSKQCSALPCGEYVIHYMPASSLFVRDPTSGIQQYLADKMPLINYGKSPIWLVHGTDHRENDFVTGFFPPVGQWTEAKW